MINQINGISTAVGAGAAAPAKGGGAAAFQRVLETAINRGSDVKISTHAGQRLRERNITLADSDMRRISQAAQRVAAKGGKDALVVMDKVGLILDVANRTVVTAIDKQQMEASVFTNIDSAVFA